MVFFNIVGDFIIVLLSSIAMGSRQTRIRSNDKAETVNELRLEKIVEENLRNIDDKNWHKPIMNKPGKSSVCIDITGKQES